MYICDSLRDLVSFVHFKKCENAHEGVFLGKAIRFSDFVMDSLLSLLFYSCWRFIFIVI